MKIGIFDSGLGGLSVLYEAKKLLPHAQYIYYADEEHVPYGEKTREQIQKYVTDIIHFLIAQGVDAIIIACNTATSVVTREFRSTFAVPIIGMEPAVKKAVDMYEHENKRILVAATPVTIRGDKLYHLVEAVDRKHFVDLISLPQLVRFAEKGDFESSDIDTYLQEMLKIYDLQDYSTVVLGCTHFNYFKEKFMHVFPQPVHFVDGNEGTIRQLIRLLPKDCELSHYQVEYYFSGRKINHEEYQHIQKLLNQLEKMYDFEYIKK